MYQVLYNLVENAIKYMDHTSGALVEIECKAGENEHAIAVRDNGPGIPPSTKPKFSRSSTPWSRSVFPERASACPS